jgi:hypothetical protein
MMNNSTAVGREEIITLVEQFLPITTWRTVRAWKAKYGLPIEYFPNGRPFLSEQKLTAWMERKKLNR